VVDQTTMTTPGVSHPSTTTVAEFHRVLDERAVQPVFQPLIDLDNRHVVGYEALTRGADGLGPGDAGGPVRAAWRAGRVAELDWACRAAAFTEAVRGGLGPPRTLAGDPARLLATVAQARQAGWGWPWTTWARPGPLAVLPFARPDLIKLDMRLLQGRTTTEAAHVVNTVRAQAERTDAVVIAEGIETIKHAREAAAAGATIGQGFPFGYPAPLASPLPPPGAAIPLQVPVDTAVETPWEVVAAAREPRRATKDLLVEMSMQLEHQGLDAAERNVLLACFQEADHFTPAARSRFEFLATRAAFTGALGHDMPVSPVAGVRGADLAADDPLRREWALVVIGPRFAAALVARDLGDEGRRQGAATASSSPTTASWSSAPPSPCCGGWSPNADPRPPLERIVAGGGQTGRRCGSRSWSEPRVGGCCRPSPMTARPRDRRSWCGTSPGRWPSGSGPNGRAGCGRPRPSCTRSCCGPGCGSTAATT
jgi:Sensory domain in DIguanylate Cyclases and Two-component system/EAL domain